MKDYYIGIVFVYLIIACLAVGCLAVSANEYKRQEGYYFVR